MVARIAQLEYSTYGHIHTVGDKVFEGLKEAGVQVDRFRIEETLPKEVLAKMGAPENLRADLPVFEASKLPEYDGIIFGFPTRYGRTPAQVSALFDRTGGIWAKGELVGKFASVFVSTASQHGGQETTALTTYPFFAHHGMNIVNFGYQHPAMFGLDEVVGSSAYGAGTLAAGDGSRQPSEAELSIAHAHGKHFGMVLKDCSVVATHKLGSEKLAAKLAAEKNGEPAAAAGTEGATKSAEETQEAPKEESADKQAEQDKPAEETPAEKKEDAKDGAPAEENVKQKKGTFKKIKNRISKIL
ncbi:putative NADH-quinone oxidoreductase [Wallemia mellicola]|uniref:Putative NADH-quinone oxidoreductase n=1 Tax=Wallemia mellicola TaxID=1708541 RepID=A0A4T0P4M6_9BASI|nr:putative NADH-quinone oxidoreductase [Wallemia mellicola]